MGGWSVFAALISNLPPQPAQPGSPLARPGARFGTLKLAPFCLSAPCFGGGMSFIWPGLEFRYHAHLPICDEDRGYLIELVRARAGETDSLHLGQPLEQPLETMNDEFGFADFRTYPNRAMR